MRFKPNLTGTAWLLLGGLAIRELFSFWTGHPYDFELWVRLGYAMFHGGDPYGSLPPAPGLSFANPYNLRDTPTIAYLPFWPLTTALMYAAYSALGINDRFVYYFLLKQPVIMSDIALAYLLYRYVRSRKATAALWSLRFWILSPFTIILSGIWGMFDSIAMALVVISLATTKWARRASWAGLAIFAKSIPIIFAFPLSLNRSRVWQSFLIAVLVPTVLSGAIFLAMNWSIPAITSALGYTVTRWGESMSLWDGLFYFDDIGILPTPTVLETSLAGALWIPALIIATIVAYRKFRSETDYGLLQTLLLLTLTFLLFRARVTEQYALYLIALSILDVTLWNPSRKPILLATTIVVTAYLITHNFLLVRFLSPAYLNAQQIETALLQAIGQARLTTDFALGTAFTFLNVWYLKRVFRDREHAADADRNSLSDSFRPSLMKPRYTTTSHKRRVVKRRLVMRLAA